MSVITRILVPTDFSACARRAVDQGIHVAVRLAVPLVLVHVHAAPTVFLPDDVREMPETEEEVVAALAHGLSALAVHAREQGASEVDTVVAHGDPGDTVVRIARERGCDLIVMGTHGRSGVRHALLGSVAEKVVRHAGCPVLIVGPHAADKP